MIAVVGASGVGKSTLLHCVGGLDAIDGGSIAIAGTELSSVGDDERVAFRNRHVGFVFQFHHLLPEFSAVENVAMPLRIARAARGEANRRAEALLREVGLGERLSHRPGMLSGGEQQRAAVARALVMHGPAAGGRAHRDLDEQTGRDLPRCCAASTSAAAHLAHRHPQPAAGAACDRILRSRTAACGRLSGRRHHPGRIGEDGAGRPPDTLHAFAVAAAAAADAASNSSTLHAFVDAALRA